MAKPKFAILSVDELLAKGIDFNKSPGDWMSECLKAQAEVAYNLGVTDEQERYQELVGSCYAVDRYPKMYQGDYILASLRLMEQMSKALAKLTAPPNV